MSTSKEIIEIQRKLKEHEKRIETLENLVKGTEKRSATETKSIFDHLTHMKSEGYFDQPKTLREIVERLAREGYHYPQQSLTEPLQRAVRQRVLGRMKQDGKWAYCKR